MKNKDIIKNYNVLQAVQESERQYYQKTGKTLFLGRVKILYAIRKNMEELMEKLGPYNETLKTLNEEYRNIEKEQEILQEAAKQYQEKVAQWENGERENRPEEPMIPAIFKEGKRRDEYDEKYKELLEIEVNDVNIYKVDIMLLDGVEISSVDLGALMFMLEEK